MLDEGVVIDLVKQKNYPPNWRIFHGTGNYGCALLCWLVVPLIIWWGSTMWSGMNTTLFLFLGIPCAISIAFAIGYWHKASSDASSILIVLPDGVVQCYAGKLENISSLYFSHIEKIELAKETAVTGVDGDISTIINYWLDVYSDNGTYIKWWINNCFNDKALIGKTIIAAYSHYWSGNKAVY